MQGQLDYNWFYSLKTLAHFRYKEFVDFLNYVTQINCLTGAIIARHILRIIYIQITKYNPPQEPPPDCILMKVQAGLKERPASWEGGRERRPQQEILDPGQREASSDPPTRSPAAGPPGW
jgi:hypothetical protein